MVSDEAKKRIFEVIYTMTSNKSEMIMAGEHKRTVVCPRCQGELTLWLVGRKNHARMSCARKCGMEGME